MRTTLYYCSLATVAASLPGIAAGATVMGDFENGLSGWTASGSVSASTDSMGGFALFQEAGSVVGQPATSTLHRDFIVSATETRLSFEYAFESLGAFGGQGFLPDAFTARLIDPVTQVPLMNTGYTEYFYEDARGQADSRDYDPATVERLESGARQGWATVMLDLSSVAPGTQARLQFDLLGTGSDDGQQTVAAVDNILVIPEPASALLALVQLPIVCRLRRRRASRHRS